MGQRANFAIIESGDWRLYYDHWAANRLDVELFWGPAVARAFIEQRAPVDDRADWLTEKWCEGGAVLDVDRRRLLWFGGEDVLYDIDRRRRCLALQRDQWSGWDVRWAHAGVEDLVDAIGEDAARLRDRARDKEPLTVAEDDDCYADLLVSVLRRGTFRIGRAHGDSGALLDPDLVLERLAGLESTDLLEWGDSLPHGGVHIDRDRHELFHWWADAKPFLASRVAEAWPGWNTFWLQDRLEKHLDVLGDRVRLARRHGAEIDREILATLERGANRPASNPAEAVWVHMPTKWISPDTAETRASAGDPSDKAWTLAELRRRLAP